MKLTSKSTLLNNIITDILSMSRGSAFMQDYKWIVIDKHTYKFERGYWTKAEAEHWVRQGNHAYKVTSIEAYIFIRLIKIMKKYLEEFITD